MVEDSETGVAAALAAGMSVIGFTGASHIPAHHPDRLRALGARQIVESMDRLPGVVAALDGAGLSVRRPAHPRFKISAS